MRGKEKTIKEQPNMTTQQIKNMGSLDIESILAVLQKLIRASQNKQASMRFEWTPAATERLLALKQDGYTYSEIGKKMGITKGAVRNKLYRIKQDNAQKAETSKEAATVKMTIIYENGILAVNDITINRKEV